MSKEKDWNKEQPHDAKSGRFTTEKRAEKHPDKVVWVKEKKSK